MTGANMEREQSYKDAAEHYEKAWKHENQASAQVSGGRRFVGEIQPSLFATPRIPGLSLGLD